MPYRAPNEYYPRVHGRLVSYSRRVDDLAPEEFLVQARGQERFYWRDGRSGLTLAGMGAAADIMGWGDTRVEAVKRQAEALFGSAVTVGAEHPAAAPRLFGGFAFRSDFVPDVTWSGFNPGHFILPHIQMVYDNGQSWLTINALIGVNDAPEKALPQLEEALGAWNDALHGDAPANEYDYAQDDESVHFPMEYPAWEEIINHAVDNIRTTALEKVVLARVCEVNRRQPIDINQALQRLRSRFPECFLFLFEPRPGHAFFGATPELLIAVEEDEFRTMGLAGSIQRGHDAESDAHFARALLDSNKDLHEHELVVRALRERLKPVAASLEMPGEPEVYQLSNIQHLYTPVQGTLQAADGVLPLVDVLHPTPALGGTPRDLALPYIRDLEPVPRGWYAAPVGWIDQRMDGAFAVAIRSAVVQNRRAWLYAGAGIVGDSIAKSEWEETGWKFRPMQGALGVNESELAKKP